MTLTCFDRYNKILKITQLMARICGANVMDPAYKPFILTWIVVTAINIFYGCTVYTMYNGLVVQGDWKLVLQTLSLVGSAVQGYSKLISCIARRKIMIAMKDYLDSIYIEYQKIDDSYRKVLRYRTDLISKLLKIVLGIYVFTVITIVCYPLIYWLRDGVKMLIMQFLIPGIDPNTEFGFLVHIGTQTILMFMGGFGNFAGDMFILIFIVNIPLQRDILQVKLHKLNEVISKEYDMKPTMQLVKEIVQLHQNYNRFVQQVEEVFYVVIFIQVFTSVASICCTLFSIVIGSWPAAFAYLIYSSSMLYAYCGLGHLVEISNDDVINTIYTECLWYELPVREQKLFLLMLRKSQMPFTLTIGHIMPLSMSTALQLTKCIYSYMMMLMNFLEGDEL